MAGGNQGTYVLVTPVASVELGHLLNTQARGGEGPSAFPARGEKQVDSLLGRDTLLEKIRACLF